MARGADVLRGDVAEPRLAGDHLFLDQRDMLWRHDRMASCLPGPPPTHPGGRRIQ